MGSNACVSSIIYITNIGNVTTNDTFRSNYTFNYTNDWFLFINILHGI